MLPTFVIGLREGLEASLIVGIIAAFLIQRGERRALRPMWIGVAIAIGLCTAAAVVLRAIGESLPLRQRATIKPPRTTNKTKPTCRTTVASARMRKSMTGVPRPAATIER